MLLAAALDMLPARTGVTASTFALIQPIHGVCASDAQGLKPFLSLPNFGRSKQTQFMSFGAGTRSAIPPAPSLTGSRLILYRRGIQKPISANYSDMWGNKFTQCFDDAKMSDNRNGSLTFSYINRDGGI